MLSPATAGRERLTPCHQTRGTGDLKTESAPIRYVPQSHRLGVSATNIIDSHPTR
jgi:hypothetical protein